MVFYMMSQSVLNIFLTSTSFRVSEHWISIVVDAWWLDRLYHVSIRLIGGWLSFNLKGILFFANKTLLIVFVFYFVSQFLLHGIIYLLIQWWSIRSWADPFHILSLFLNFMLLVFDWCFLFDQYIIRFLSSCGDGSGWLFGEFHVNFFLLFLQIDARMYVRFI